MPFTGYRVTSPFGWRTHPVKKTRAFHTGIDLVKYHKAPINAFTEGTVLFAGFGKSGSGFGGYGNVVLIKDKNNRGQVYAHLDSVAVRPGQKVVKGQTIGYQGNTGISTGSHLHYEVRKRAESKSPYGWIADRANNCLSPTTYLKGYYVVKSSKGIVLTIQSTLNSRYNLKIKVDNIFGRETKAALIKALQTELNKQFKKGLVVDGKWGPKTKAASVAVKEGAKGNITWIIQAILYCLGFDPKGLDSIFGKGTSNAVIEFQKSKKIKADGVVGSITFEKMFA